MQHPLPHQSMVMDLPPCLLPPMAQRLTGVPRFPELWQTPPGRTAGGRTAAALPRAATLHPVVVMEQGLVGLGEEGVEVVTGEEVAAGAGLWVGEVVMAAAAAAVEGLGGRTACLAWGKT